jgi:hypothetical protein
MEVSQAREGALSILIRASGCGINLQHEPDDDLNFMSVF